MRELYHLSLRRRVATTRQWPRGSPRMKANGQLSSVGARREAHAPSREYRMLRGHGHSGLPIWRPPGDSRASFDQPAVLVRPLSSARNTASVHRRALKAEFSSAPVAVLISCEPMQQVVGRLAIRRQKATARSASKERPCWSLLRIAAVQRAVRAGTRSSNSPILAGHTNGGLNGVPAVRQHPFCDRGATRWQIFI